MMNPQNFHEAQTVLSLPAVMPSIPKTPRTDKIRISPMRLCAIQASMRATAFSTTSQPPLKAAMHTVFMATTAYFHEHREVAMAVQVASALQRMRNAGQASLNALFVDLRQVSMSPAGQDVGVKLAVQAAEQVLLHAMIQ
jgi:hypothetical protein